MQDAVRVEIVPLMVPTDDRTRENRQKVVDRLADMGQIDPTTGEIPDEMQQGWMARIGGAEFGVVTFSVEPPEDGRRALVSLLVPADSVQVGNMAGAATATPQPPVEAKPPVQVWGSATKDPRENIPGWREAQAAQSAHDHTLKRWTCGCDPVLLGIQEAAAKTDNIDLRVVQG